MRYTCLVTKYIGVMPEYLSWLASSHFVILSRHERVGTDTATVFSKKRGCAEATGVVLSSGN